MEVLPLKWRNWLQHWLLRFTSRQVPGLGKLLNLANGTVDRLAEEVQMHRQQAQWDSRAADDYLSELREAEALASNPWLGGAQSNLPAVRALREAASRVEEIRARETLYGSAEMELAIEDRGWKRMIAQSQYEFSRFGLQSIMLICRLYFIKNPLIRRGVEVCCNYVFGRGMEVSSPDPDANETLQNFFNDPRNKSQLSHNAFTTHEQSLFTDGNVFWALFTDPKDGQTVIRSIDALEISDIITDPNDSEIPWFYRREWIENFFDVKTGDIVPTPKTAWYFAIGWEDLPDFPAETRKVRGEQVALDGSGQPIPVMHIKDGGLPKHKFGIAKAYCAIDFAKAYRTGLEDLCTMWRALSRYAWMVETKGGAPAIAAFKQSLQTTLAQDLTSIDNNPPPVTGSAYISTPGSKVTPMKTAGSTMNPEDLRRVMLMVCAAFGLGEHMVGDISVGNLATATALERPTELMFLERQEAWRQIVQQLCHYVLARSLKAPNGKLREAMAHRQNIETSAFRPETVKLQMTPLKADYRGLIRMRVFEAQQTTAKTDAITVEVKFPDILAHDIEKRINAIVEAGTLNGFEVNGIDERVMVGMLLSELGYENVDELLEIMYPKASYEKQQDRTVQPEQPGKITGKVEVPQNPNAPLPEQVQQEPTKESRQMARVLAEMRRVIKLHESKIVEAGYTLPR